MDKNIDDTWEKTLREQRIKEIYDIIVRKQKQETKSIENWYENLSWQEKLKLNWPTYLASALGMVVAGFAVGYGKGHSKGYQEGSPSKEFMDTYNTGKKFEANW